MFSNTAFERGGPLLKTCKKHGKMSIFRGPLEEAKSGMLSLAAPMGATFCPGLASKWILARVVVPKGQKRAHKFCEGARHGDVCSVRNAELLRVDDLARTRTFWILKLVLSVAPPGAPRRSWTTAQSWCPQTQFLSPGSAAAAASSRSAECLPWWGAAARPRSRSGAPCGRCAGRLLCRNCRLCTATVRP